MPYNSIIALGANLHSSTGAPIETLRQSQRLLELESVNVGAESRWYKTPAFPIGAGPDFVNGALSVETDLPPEKLLAVLHAVEAKLGRIRADRWGARVCDLDLITYSDRVLPDRDTFRSWYDLGLEGQMRSAPEGLILPHPRLQDRAFVLIPMRDVAPNWVHPVTGQSIDEMIAALPAGDVSAVEQM